jgi:hypothetical protein
LQDIYVVAIKGAPANRRVQIDGRPQVDSYDGGNKHASLDNKIVAVGDKAVRSMKRSRKKFR